MPFVLEAMEHQLDEFRTRENRHLQRRPKEYFRQFWVSYWFEKYAPRLLSSAHPAPRGFGLGSQCEGSASKMLSGVSMTPASST